MVPYAPDVVLFVQFPWLLVIMDATTHVCGRMKGLMKTYNNDHHECNFY